MTTSVRQSHARSRIWALLSGLVFAGAALAQQPVTLHGAVQFADEHTFNKTLLKFEELTKKY